MQWVERAGHAPSCEYAILMHEMGTAKMLDEGMKLDDGKLDYSLIDATAEAEMVGVLTFGAIKYARGNWRKVADAENRYFSALRRHLHAARSGEDVDGETQMMHLANAACCLHFLLAIALEKRPKLVTSFATRLANGLHTARELRAARTVAP
jgi:hypothetical protein